MKKFLTGVVLFSGVLGFTAGVSATETTDDPSAGLKTVIDQNDTTVEVEGTLGIDNTDPTAPIDEGDKKWVNVTVPMKTIFYSVGSSGSVSSPTYTVKNNSGRPVTVSAESFTTKSAGGITATDLDLDLKTSTAVTAPVITDGDSGVLTTTSLGELANSEGRLVNAGPTGQSQELTFFYDGNFTAGSSQATITETYDLSLKFVPIKW